MLRDRPKPANETSAGEGRLPFLESSLRILPAHSNDSDTTDSGRRTLIRTGIPQGWLCRQPADAAQGGSHERDHSELTPAVLATGLAISLHIV